MHWFPCISVSSIDFSMIRLSAALIHIGIDPQKIVIQVTESRLCKFINILELYTWRLVEDFRWTNMLLLFQ